MSEVPLYLSAATASSRRATPRSQRRVPTRVFTAQSIITTTNNAGWCGTVVPRLYENATPWDPTVALCLETCGNLRGMSVFNERGTPVPVSGNGLEQARQVSVPMSSSNTIFFTAEPMTTTTKIAGAGPVSGNGLEQARQVSRGLFDAVAHPPPRAAGPPLLPAVKKSALQQFRSADQKIRRSAEQASWTLSPRLSRAPPPGPSCPVSTSAGTFSTSSRTVSTPAHTVSR